MDFTGLTAVVTGAASGIGRALTIDLVGRGARVAASDLDAAGLAETASLCASGEFRGYDLDVADRGAVLQHAEEVARDFGDVHLLINNAGVALVATVEEMSWADYDWLMGVNVGGVVNGTKAFLPHLIRSGDGHLVNISSAFGFLGVPTLSAYTAAKFAVRGFTEALRQEMIMSKRPVSVHCVHPGGIRTGIVANARTGPSVGLDKRRQVRDFALIARTSPEGAARAILRGVARNSPRILVGPDAYVLDALPRLVGARYQGIAARGARTLGRRFGLDPDR
jgi:NAD(P)-dependent dehydrogenase (short-subunit alcohol dehydrogenase family)